MVRELIINTPGSGLHEITDRVQETVRLATGTGSSEDSSIGSSSTGDSSTGLCTVFVRHTSASLTIQENADPSAKRDLEHWLARLVPENDPLFTHTAEGPDDMPSHIRAALTATSLTIPVVEGRLGLGTWQGVYLWEHRRSPHTRRVLVHVATDPAL